MKSSLIRIFEYLNQKKTSNFALFPRLWDPSNSDFQTGEISQDPYAFYSRAFDFILNYNHNNANDNNKNKLRLYGGHLRSLTAYNHKNALLNTDGTFIKAIVLLPYLKKLEVNALYLLPINKPSTHVLKGQLPSPYASKSFLDLDPFLDDKLLEGNFSSDEQFQALIDACHLLGIKVILDFVFRTVGRDHDWVFQNPNWFCWIEKSFESEFKAPKIKYLHHEDPEILISKQIESSDIALMFNNEHLKDYLKNFKALPENLINETRTGQISDLLTIEKKYNITTAPAFSDWFNDNQPPWTDITYLRFYLDHPNESKKFLDPDQPPYQLYDVIHCDRIDGDIINTELWNRLMEIIPNFQKKFSIDGARIDMAHSMPLKLMDLIIAEAKKNNPHFLFISEDFNMDPEANIKKKDNYDILLGNLWFYESIEGINELKDVLYYKIAKTPIPIIASSETADTSRTAQRVQDSIQFSKSMYLLNTFIPNSHLFINSGFEILEKIALNGALNHDTTKEKKLIKNAFFNSFIMNWNREKASSLLNFIKKVNTLFKSIESEPQFIQNQKAHVIAIDVTPFILVANFSNESVKKGPEEFKYKNVLISSCDVINTEEIGPFEVILASKK